MKTLKELRLENGLSIIDMATKASVSFGTIVRIENGLPTKPVTKRKITKALHKRLSDIDFNLSYKLPLAFLVSNFLHDIIHRRISKPQMTTWTLVNL